MSRKGTTSKVKGKSVSKIVFEISDLKSETLKKEKKDE
jgi:hypothetical protein